jgi:nicotinamidase-related amidase
MTQAASKFHEPLTVENAALVLIDHQTGTMLMGIEDIDPVNLMNNTRFLAETANKLDIPTVLTASNEDGPTGPLIPDLLELAPNAKYVSRNNINAWHDNNFVEAIQATGRKKLIMAGISTDVCLTFPAIAAVAEGYDVFAVIDASGTWSLLAQQTAISRMSQAGVVCVNTVAVIAELLADWTAPGMERKMGPVFVKYMPNFGMLLNNMNYIQSQKAS